MRMLKFQTFKSYLIAVLIIVQLCLSGCAKIGKGTDTIKVSDSDVTVSAAAQTVNLYTEGEFYFDCVYYSTEKEGVEIYDVTIGRGDHTGGEYDYDYTAPWFSIRTSNNRHQIIIDLQENTTGKSRHFRAQIYSWDYFQWISVTQNAK